MGFDGIWSLSDPFSGWLHWFTVRRRKSFGALCKALTAMSSSPGKKTEPEPGISQHIRAWISSLIPDPLQVIMPSVTRVPHLLFRIRMFVYVPRQNGSGISVALQ